VYVQSDTNARRAGFLTHNYGDYNARDQADLEAVVAEGSETLVGHAFPVARGANVNGFQFQMTNPIYQDDRVRQGISKAFDRAEYDLARNGGDNQSPNGAFSNSPMPWPLMYDAYPTGEVNGQWYQFDAAEGSKMLQAAGY